MQPEQQRIMGYFIEEAKEHLNTIEQGLLSLQRVVEDPEMLGEVFRAAHSVKGGAAMLGIDSIQQTAHALEDYFKVLQEHPVKVDQKLESLFFQGFDTLRELLEELQGPFGLTDEVAVNATQTVEVVSVQLRSHLDTLVSQTSKGVSTDGRSGVSPGHPVDRPSESQEENALLKTFQNNVPSCLREMLQLFKQADSPASRQELQTVLQSLAQMGEQFKLTRWHQLIELSRLAVANPKNSYFVLAPVLIKDIKAARDLVLAGCSADIVSSQQLQALAPSEPTPVSKDEPVNQLNFPPEVEMQPLASSQSVESSDEALFSDVVVFNQNNSSIEATSQGTSEFLFDVEDLFTVSSDLDSEANFTNSIDLDELFSGDDVTKDKQIEELPASSMNDLEAELPRDQELKLSTLEDDSELDVELELLAEDPEDLVTLGPLSEEVSTSILKLEQGGSLELQVAELNELIEEPNTLELDALLQNLDGGGGEPGTTFNKDTTYPPNEELDEVLKDTSSTEFPGEREDDLVGFSFESAPLDSESSPGADAAVEMLPLEQTSRKVPEVSTDTPDFAELEASSEESSGTLSAPAIEPTGKETHSGPESSLTTQSSEPDTLSRFSELEALLAEENLGEAQSPTLVDTPQKSLDPEFADLENLIEDTGTLKSPAKAEKENKAAQSKPRQRASGNFGEQTMRVPVKQLDNLGNLVGELVVDRNSLEQNQERLRQSLDNLLYQAQQLNNVGQQMQDLYEQSLLESSLLSVPHPYRSQYASASDSHRTVADETRHSTGTQFDALEMDRFTGFHTLSQEVIERIVRLREAASDIEFTVDESDQIARMFRQATAQLQEGLTQSRMVPFAQIAERLPRAVRDIALKCGKRASLEIEGRETLIDKGILERLYDPMTHLVNNTLTHGIELPEVRQSLGKPPAGQIKVQAFYQGNQTIISVSDDGAGIDPERVKAKAIEKGLVSPSAAESLSQIEIYNLLFLSGFSTKDQADDLAGRGVGMDVVRTSLDEVRGIISIDSTLGKGTTFTIRLPLTLSIAKALFCIDNHCRIAFPLDGVEDVLDIRKDSIQSDAEGNPVLEWRNLLVPFRPLSELLTHNRRLSRGNLYGGSQDENLISVVILGGAGKFLAIQVGQTLGEQEIVIKQLQGPVPKPIGLTGVTVLGDGRIMPIADVLELIDLATGKLTEADTLWKSGGAITEPDQKTESLVLIVDDSITVRELLSITFNKVGYRVEQARDGLEAWEKLRSGLPCDLVFCDIEMPRMDGLELLTRIQQDPLLNHLPIAMLSSRGADRHRQMAIQLGAKGYFTKPYLEEALLDAAQRLLQGEVLAS